MDSVYRSQRHVYDFTRKYYLLGHDRLIADLALKPGDRVIEIGCGTGRNLVKMARRYPLAHFYGLDASQQILRSAQIAIIRAGLSDRIHLACGHAEGFSPITFGLGEPFRDDIFPIAFQ